MFFLGFDFQTLSFDLFCLNLDILWEALFVLSMFALVCNYTHSHTQPPYLCSVHSTELLRKCVHAGDGYCNNNGQPFKG